MNRSGRMLPGREQTADLHKSGGGGEVDFEAAGEEGCVAAVAFDLGALVGAAPPLSFPTCMQVEPFATSPSQPARR